MAPQLIPDPDMVSRLVKHPHMSLTVKEEQMIWRHLFDFPGGQHESVTWRKYAPKDQDVHTLGFKWEAAKRLSKPDVRYRGFVTAIVGHIRAICNTSPAGHGFRVEHMPDEGIEHAGIAYELVGGSTYDDLSPSVKSDLRYRLERTFGPLTSA